MLTGNIQLKHKTLKRFELIKIIEKKIKETLKDISVSIVDVYLCQSKDGKISYLENKEKERNDVSDPRDHTKTYPHYPIRTEHAVESFLRKSEDSNSYYNRHTKNIYGD